MEVEVLAFAPAHVAGICSVAAEVGWPSLTDPVTVLTVCTAPGASAVVAVDGGEVVGFAQALGDGVLQSHLSFLAVRSTRRRRGVAGRLTRAVFAATGTQRMDLVTDDAHGFYRSMPHQVKAGYRIYPAPPGRP